MKIIIIIIVTAIAFILITKLVDYDYYEKLLREKYTLKGTPIKVVADTSGIVQNTWDCLGMVKHPYYLIQWDDKTYGILFKDTYMNWYKVINETTGHHFTDILERGEHFKDSCKAKQNLKQFLDSRVTYKIIK